MAAETDEPAGLTTNRDRLQHEQERLLQAHYADAIPNWAQDSNKTRTPANDSLGKLSRLVRSVGRAGLEPATQGL